MRSAILRDRNRACVVQWELFNELKRPVLKQQLLPSAMLARKLDPTRLILDESGGWAQGANMYLPYKTVPTKFNDIHHYPGQQINDEVLRVLTDPAGNASFDDFLRQDTLVGTIGRSDAQDFITRWAPADQYIEVRVLPR